MLYVTLLGALVAFAPFGSTAVTMPRGYDVAPKLGGVTKNGECGTRTPDKATCFGYAEGSCCSGMFSLHSYVLEVQVLTKVRVRLVRCHRRSLWCRLPGRLW